MDVRIGIGDSSGSGDLAPRTETQMQPFDGIQRDSGSRPGGSEHIATEPESRTVSMLQ